MVFIRRHSLQRRSCARQRPGERGDREQRATIARLAAEARLRGTDAKLAAAGRSASVTTVITQDDRVGTSICGSAVRTSSGASAIDPSVRHADG
jgi:hypothetical protein